MSLLGVHYKQICKHGHDTFIVGRTKKGQCKTCRLIATKLYQKTSPNRKIFQRKYALKKKYGITLEQYNELFISQKGTCAICNRHQSEFKRPLAVDHCHMTNRIRGLLCPICNTNLEVLENKNIVCKLLYICKKAVK